MRGLTRRPLLALVLMAMLSVAFTVSPVLAVLSPIYYPCPVGFSASPTTGYAPLYVQFTDKTDWCWATPTAGEPEGIPCNWVVTWDFGDGGTAVRRVEAVGDVPLFDSDHTYTKPGKYTVTLTYEWECEAAAPGDTVRPSKLSFTETRKMYITVLEKEKERKLEPADMLVSYLNIDPQQVLPGQEVTVSANICNSGQEAGTKTASLAVNGVAEQSQTVGVSGGSCQKVSFRVARTVPGTYQVSIDGMTGQFSVLAPRTVTNTVASQQDVGLGTAGIAAIAAVGIALVIALVMLFKKD